MTGRFTGSSEPTGSSPCFPFLKISAKLSPFVVDV